MRLNGSIGMLVAVLAATLLLAACEKRAEKPKLNPTAVRAQIFDSVMALMKRGGITSEEEFDAARDRYAARMIDDVRSDSLQGDELFAYGNILSWSGNERRAKQVFNQLRQEKGELASAAWKELITLEIEGNKGTQAEAMMKEFRAALPPDTSDLDYLFFQCSSLADRYGRANDPEAAIRVCMDELNVLPLDLPYRSFYLVATIAANFLDMDRVDESRAILDTYRAKLQGALDLRGRSASADSGGSEKEAIDAGFQELIDHLASLSSQYALIGKKAPGFKFLHVYNADSSLTLEAFKGKVLMLDFWTTWCVPCVIGFVEAQRIYDDYRSKGFEILGITSLQGMYYDADADSAEGTKEKPLDEAREIELTGEYIQKRRMIWPVAISDRSVFDPAYSINGVPTFVLIDREGIVRYIQTGIGSEIQKRRIIDRIINKAAGRAGV